MSKSETFINNSILDSINISVKKKPSLSDITKRYNLAFLELTKCLVNDSIFVDEYLDLLHTLLTNYRKEKSDYVQSSFFV